MRIKRGETKRQKKKAVLKQAKGYRMSYHKLYRRAKEALLHAGQYEYAHRKRRKSQIKTEWIRIISAALSGSDLSYNSFMNALKTNNVLLDRKIIAELVINNPKQFELLLAAVK